MHVGFCFLPCETRTLLEMLSCDIEVTAAGKHNNVRRRGMGLTQGRFVANGIAQKIPRAYGGQLGETFHESLGLCAFANARRTDEDDASGAFELLGGHSDAICRYAERGGF